MIVNDYPEDPEVFEKIPKGPKKPKDSRLSDSMKRRVAKVKKRKQKWEDICK